MIFSLQVMRAKKGDCLLLHFGSRDEPGLVLIDGGPAGVYKPHLRPHLARICKSRGIDNGPLPIDLLMVSHIDDDHIRGILDLTEELMDRSKPPFVAVQRIWHNSFDDLVGETAAVASVARQFGAAALDQELETKDAETVRDNVNVLASIAQGQRLRGDTERLQQQSGGFAHNEEFGGDLIRASPTELPLDGGLSFVIAGPMQPELERLRKLHAEWMRTRKDEDASAGALAAYVDDSVANLSSIVALAKCGGKSMLLTGDARGDKILEGLEASGVIARGGSLHVDVLKAPHHGSARNVERDFFTRITAEHYVFSGDGKHGNPERETLEMLFDARGDVPFHVHLTYPVNEIDLEREADWKQEQAKELARKRRGSDKEPREDWSAEKHGLAAFLNRSVGANGKIHIVHKSAPHVIDLLEKVGS